MSFSAFIWAALIFCFSLKLSSNSNFILCSLSARSIDKLSLYVSSFSKILPHSAPKLHFCFSWVFYSRRIANLYLNLLFWSCNSYIPWLSCSYLSSIWPRWIYLTLPLQIFIPCLKETFIFPDNVDKAILMPSSFFSLYSPFISFSSSQYTLLSLMSLLYSFNSLAKSSYLESIFPLDYFSKIALKMGSLLFHLFQYLPNPWAIFSTFDSDFFIFCFTSQYCCQLWKALTISSLFPHSLTWFTTFFIVLLSFSFFFVKNYLISSGSYPSFIKLFVAEFTSPYP